MGASKRQGHLRDAPDYLFKYLLLLNLLLYLEAGAVPALLVGEKRRLRSSPSSRLSPVSRKHFLLDISSFAALETRLIASLTLTQFHNFTVLRRLGARV